MNPFKMVRDVAPLTSIPPKRPPSPPRPPAPTPPHPLPSVCRVRGQLWGY